MQTDADLPVNINHPQEAHPLTEADLAAGGYKKISAYVQSDKPPTRHANRTRDEKLGRQVNVIAPIEAHQVIKALAKDLQQNSTAQDALLARLAAELLVSDPAATVQVVPERHAAWYPKAVALSQLKGWRRFVARLIGLL